MQLVNMDKWKALPYAEIGQSNQLKWQNLKHIAEDTFEPVSYRWQCKDFMNEVVTSWWLNRKFSIYGFSVDPETFFNREWEGLPLLLYNVAEGWQENMQVVNDHLLEQGMPPVSYESTPSGWFINIPEEYMSNTFFMSQVTLFIRLANTTKVYQSLADMVTDTANRTDATNFKACLNKPLGSFPASLEKYIWYYDDGNNLTRDYPADKNIQTSMMHNCGVVAWGWK